MRASGGPGVPPALSCGRHPFTTTTPMPPASGCGRPCWARHETPRRLRPASPQAAAQSEIPIRLSDLTAPVSYLTSVVSFAIAGAADRGTAQRIKRTHDAGPLRRSRYRSGKGHGPRTVRGDIGLGVARPRRPGREVPSATGPAEIAWDPPGVAWPPRCRPVRRPTPPATPNSLSHLSKGPRSGCFCYRDARPAVSGGHPQTGAPRFLRRPAPPARSDPSDRSDRSDGFDPKTHTDLALSPWPRARTMPPARIVRPRDPRRST